VYQTIVAQLVTSMTYVVTTSSCSLHILA